jgi:hypothetical protein
VSQRQILENSIDLLKTLRGPAKVLYAGSEVGFPSQVENIINPTTGAPAASWSTFGLTRGGINVGKTLTIAVRDDVDQILGAYDQDITDRSYAITTQIAEVIGNPNEQAAIALDMGATLTFSTATTGAPTQVMRFLDDSDNKTQERRWAVVFPKAQAGKVIVFVFRRAAVSGGDKTWRFDKNDPASPALELRAFPEIATTIDTMDAYGRYLEIF